MLIVALAGLCASIVYTIFAVIRLVTFPPPAERGEGGPKGRVRGVTIAKPLCGAEPELLENLRSFREQDYPDFEVLFAVGDPNDEALPVAGQLGEVIVAARAEGGNRKVNSLIAIEERAKGEIIVVADSDMRVGPDYLRSIVAPFEDERVGAVTCLYVGTTPHPPLRGTLPAPRGTSGVEPLVSRLGAMYINESFLPSVLVALALQPLDFCLGATMAVRRPALDSIGGFSSLAGYLADDYMLGQRMRAAGWEVRLAPYVVENVVWEPSFGDLFLHELRWARTIRTVRPIGYSFSILTMMFPWVVAVLLLSRFSRPALWMAAATLGLRLLLHLTVRWKLRLARPAAVWWIPLRDALTFVVYAASHFGRSVQWKEARFKVSTDGQLHAGRARP